MIKIWIDADQIPPIGYDKCYRTTNEVINFIDSFKGNESILLDMGYRAYHNYRYGGDYDNILYKIAYDRNPRCVVRFHDVDIMDKMHMQRVATTLGLSEVLE